MGAVVNAWLASRNVSPNAISIAGMCACIIGGIALGLTSIVDYRILWIIGALGAQLRLTANMLDGMVAIASSRYSKTGELVQRSADRISDAAVFIGAGFAWGGNVTLGYMQPSWLSSPLTFDSRKNRRRA